MANSNAVLIVGAAKIRVPVYIDGAGKIFGVKRDGSTFDWFQGQPTKILPDGSIHHVYKTITGPAPTGYSIDLTATQPSVIKNFTNPVAVPTPIQTSYAPPASPAPQPPVAAAPPPAPAPP